MFNPGTLPPVGRKSLCLDCEFCCRCVPSVECSMLHCLDFFLLYSTIITVAHTIKATATSATQATIAAISVCPLSSSSLEPLSVNNKAMINTMNMRMNMRVNKNNSTV